MNSHASVGIGSISINHVVDHIGHQRFKLFATQALRDPLILLHNRVNNTKHHSPCAGPRSSRQRQCRCVSLPSIFLASFLGSSHSRQDLSNTLENEQFTDMSSPVKLHKRTQFADPARSFNKKLTERDYHNAYAIDPSILTPGLTLCAIADTIEASFATCSLTWSNVSLIKSDSVFSYPVLTGEITVVDSTCKGKIAATTATHHRPLSVRYFRKG